MHTFRGFDQFFRQKNFLCNFIEKIFIIFYSKVYYNLTYNKVGRGVEYGFV
jgi:hypothetical protein